MARFRRLHLWGIAALLVIIAAAVFIRQTHGVLESSQLAVREAGQIRFTQAALDRAPLAFESIASTSAFRDAAFFQGKLYLLSSDALYEHAASGELLRRFGAGMDLPAAPLTVLASATLPGSQETELFIGTMGEGLVSFDGRRFRQMRGAEPQHRKIVSMLPLETGQLLLGTSKAGVFVWDGSRLTRFHDAVNDVPVTSLAGTLDDLWIGTLDRGLLHLRAGQLQRFAEADGLPDAHVLSLAVRGDRAWAGTAMGIAEYRSGRFERTLADGLFANTMLAVDDTLSVGTLEEGIVDIPLALRQPRPNRGSKGEAMNRVERLWRVESTDYAVLRDGLYSRSGAEQWKRLMDPPSAMLTDNNIAALAVEPQGRIWIGYFDRGLDVVDNTASRAAHFEDEHLFCVNRIVPRNDGAVIATANGLVLTARDGKPRQVLTRSEGLIASHVTDVVVEPTGMVAATPAGITFLAPGGAQSIYAFHGLVNNHVYALAQNGSRLLAGTLGGISVVDSGIVKASYTTSNSALRHNWITSLVAVGNDWFAGTYGAGVYRFDGASWSSFPDFKSGFEVNPNAMAVSETAVYAGTLDRGLAIYNRANSRWSFLTSGLPSSNITAVAIGSGYVYVGSDNGLVRILERSVPLP
jgi:ligand-binding sensor domain-containing protein